MRRLILIFALPVLALLMLAFWQFGWLSSGQKLPGRISEYHKVYGFWDVACDTAMDGTDQRCYIQYVDVYRPRPDFAAAMVEVVMHDGAEDQPDPHVRFDIEPGLTFRDTTIQVMSPSGPLLVDTSHCTGNTCRITGNAARALLASWRQGNALAVEIGEGRAEPARLTWPLHEMPTILEDFATQRAARNLP